MKVQTITIQLKLKDGQVPYTNVLEHHGTSEAKGYDHLKQFFEEFGPPNYEVLDIESDVEEDVDSVDCSDCGKQVFNVNGDQGIHDDPKDDSFVGCGECAKKRRDA